MLPLSALAGEILNAMPTVQAYTHEKEETARFGGLRLEAGLPVWEYDIDGVRLEKRVLMPHGQNTVHVSYQLLSGPAGVRLHLSEVKGPVMDRLKQTEQAIKHWKDALKLDPTDVATRTLLASGNLVVESDREPRALESEIEAETERRFGRRVHRSGEPSGLMSAAD